MQTCRNCHPCVVREPVRHRVVVTPLADSLGWLWHVIPGHPGSRNWGEAESREEALRAGEIYIQAETNRENQI